jgi:hypothetical protein
MLRCDSVYTDEDVRKCNEMASAVGEVMVLEGRACT